MSQWKHWLWALVSIWGLEKTTSVSLHAWLGRRRRTQRLGIKAQVYILPLHRDFTPTGSLKPPHTQKAALEYLDNVQTPLWLKDQHSYWRNALALPAVEPAVILNREHIICLGGRQKKGKGVGIVRNWFPFFKRSRWKTTGEWERKQLMKRVWGLNGIIPLNELPLTSLRCWPCWKRLPVARMTDGSQKAIWLKKIKTDILFVTKKHFCH